MSTSLPNEEQFYSRIEQGLAGHPRLHALLPSGYPRRSRWRVDRERALAFEEMRTERFGHNINLPLALYLVGSEEAKPGAKGFARQLLEDVEAFAAALAHTPGTRRVLEPLWTAPWDRDDPKMWSVVAHAKTSLQLLSLGASILALEAPIGSGGKTADIQFRLEEEDYLLDLEVWNAATGTTADRIWEEGVRRAEAKAAQKFAALPQGTLGVVAEFCFAVGEPFEQIVNNSHILSAFPLSGTPRCLAQLSMICGLGDASGQIEGYRLMNSTSPRLPLLRRAAK
jgi:hypothetical protein